jgi:hypothetical protein
MQPHVSEPPVPSSSTPSSKTKLLVGGAVAVVLIVAGLIAAPILSVNAWKEKVIDPVNSANEKITATAKEVDPLVEKEDLEVSEYDRAIGLIERELGEIKTAKDTLTPIGGYAGLDVTGAYKKASDARQEMVSAYDDATKLVTTSLNRAKVARDVKNSLKSVSSIASFDDVRAVVPVLESILPKVEALANGPDSFASDKEGVVHVKAMTVAIKQMVAAYDAQDMTTLSAAANEVTLATNGLEEVNQKAAQEEKDFQKKIDSAVDRFNDAAKKL